MNFEFRIEKLYSTEKHIYGSSRLGMDARAVDMFAAATATDNGYFEEKRGEKRYELSNHLGNVLVVLSDQKLATLTSTNSLDYYTAEVLSYNDYYPFGAPMHERSGSAGGGEYRYGFNGMESIDEMVGNENGYDFGARMYDGRLGRWWSVDPVLKANENPYCGFSCNPLYFVDIDGRDTLVVHAQKLLDNNDQQTVILKITFSLIKDGVEESLSIDVEMEGGILQRNEVYFTVPFSYWKDKNIWVQENGDQEFTSIRFEEYQGGSGTNYKNAIRLKYVSNDGVRILAHKANYGSGSVGCNIPTLEIPNDGAQNFPTVGSQAILDGIRKLYEEYVPSTTETDDFGREIQKPIEGYDFMSKSNSSGATGTDASSSDLVPSVLDSAPADSTNNN